MENMNADSRCKAMEFVDPVVNDTEWTDDQKGPEMAQLAKMGIKRNHLECLVAMSAFENRRLDATDFSQPHLVR